MHNGTDLPFEPDEWHHPARENLSAIQRDVKMLTKNCVEHECIHCMFRAPAHILDMPEAELEDQADLKQTGAEDQEHNHGKQRMSDVHRLAQGKK